MSSRVYRESSLCRSSQFCIFVWIFSLHGKQCDFFWWPLSPFRVENGRLISKNTVDSKHKFSPTHVSTFDFIHEFRYFFFSIFTGISILFVSIFRVSMSFGEDLSGAIRCKCIRKRMRIELWFEALIDHKWTQHKTSYRTFWNTSQLWP